MTAVLERVPASLTRAPVASPLTVWVDVKSEAESLLPQPMKLRATPTPSATATPVEEPKAMLPATPTTVAVIVAVLDALTVTAPTGLAAVPSVPPLMSAIVEPSTTFVDSDPPPAIATPVPPPATPIDTATASDVTSMSMVSAAVTLSAPPPVVTSATLPKPA